MSNASVRYFKDKRKEVIKVAKYCIKRYLPNDRLYDKVKIHYVFWEGERTDKTKQVMRGEARIPSKRERDLYGIDFIISISEDFWMGADTKMKRLVVTHELDHCLVKIDKEDPNRPQYDVHNRPKIAIKPHDINIHTFSADIQRFGMTPDLFEAVSYMKSLDKNKKRKTRKKPKKKSKMVVKKKKK